MINTAEQRYNPFGNMNNRNRTPKNTNPTGMDSYKSWKTKDEKPKEVNLASFNDFPDLIKSAEKSASNTVFKGTSLAAKLKETIAAEEEAAILKRLKKGDTPEMILREGCVSLPLKNYKQGVPLTVPDWVTDTSEPTILPSFKHKTQEQLAQERKWKRLGINPNDTMLWDEPDDNSTYQDDKISLPSDDGYEQEELVLHED